MSTQQINPFADNNAFKNLSFADPEETEVKVVKEEAKVEDKPTSKTENEVPKEEGDGKVEIEDILDKPLVFANEEEVETKKEAKKKTEQALFDADEDFDYTALARQNIKAGIWEEYEDSETLVLDKEMFKQLVELQESTKKDKIKNTIFEGLDSDEKEFLEFKRNGGDIDQYYISRSRKQAVQTLDISTDNGKVSAIYTYYKNIVGWDDDKIKKHISTVAKDLTIDEEAQYAKDKLEKLVVEENNNLVESQRKAAEAQKEQLNAYKGSLKEVMKQYGFDNNKIKTVTESFLNRDSESGLSPIDQTYLSYKGDPKKAIDLYNFLTDQDKFVADAAKKLVDGKTKDTFLKLKTTQKESTDPSKIEHSKKRIQLFT
jgi:hypothetical protein